MTISPAPLFVVVSGPPGSGKSAVAEPLARELGLPLIAKDTIKEALMVTEPVDGGWPLLEADTTSDVPDVDAVVAFVRAAVADRAAD